MPKMQVEAVDVEEPSDPDAPIWRYLNFTKLVALLERRELYFTRVDRLTADPFEGALGTAALEALDVAFTSIPEDKRDRPRREPEASFKRYRGERLSTVGRKCHTSRWRCGANTFLERTGPSCGQLAGGPLRPTRIRCRGRDRQRPRRSCRRWFSPGAMGRCRASRA